MKKNPSMFVLDSEFVLRKLQTVPFGIYLDLMTRALVQLLADHRILSVQTEEQPSGSRLTIAYSPGPGSGPTHYSVQVQIWSRSRNPRGYTLPDHVVVQALHCGEPLPITSGSFYRECDYGRPQDMARALALHVSLLLTAPDLL